MYKFTKTFFEQKIFAKIITVFDNSIHFGGYEKWGEANQYKGNNQEKINRGYNEESYTKTKLLRIVGSEHKNMKC